MLSYSGNGGTLLRVSVQDSCQHVSSLGRYKLWYLIISTQNLLVQLRCLWILEREIAADHSIQNDAGAPDISLEAVVALPGNHLWRGIARRPAGSF
jgi:hypothetical protein